MEKPAPAVLSDNIFSVSDASTLLKSVVETAFPRIKIRGELSQITRATSGHIYMTIKDSGAAINAIVWRGTALPVQLSDGLEVIITGKFTTYPARSNYQLIVSELEMAGVGAILKMLEERKQKLAKEGLFDAARKKPLPKFPETIGVVTSPTGAAFQDIQNRLRERFPVRVLLYPAQVQGATAATEVAAGIKYFNSMTVPPDVIIVARGGGSLEDLLPFSDEIVVRAVANSKVPVVSGVGHEPDWMLIDFAADVRAATPTMAAEIALPTKISLLQDINTLWNKLDLSFINKLANAKQRLEMVKIKSPKQIVMEQFQRIDDIAKTMNLLMMNRMQLMNQKVLHLGQMLNSLSYKNVLNRGYAIVRHNDKIIGRAADFKIPAEIEFADGTVKV